MDLVEALPRGRPTDFPRRGVSLSRRPCEPVDHFVRKLRPRLAGRDHLLPLRTAGRRVVPLPALWGLHAAPCRAGRSSTPPAVARAGGGTRPLLTRPRGGRRKIVAWAGGRG